MSHLDEGQLHALLDGELTEPERLAAEAHLAGCAECRRAYAEAKELLLGADDLIGAVELPPTRSNTPGAGAAPATVRPRFHWRTVAWAASLVLAVGLGWAARSDRAPGAMGGFARAATDSPAPAAAATPAPPEDKAKLARDERSPETSTVTLGQTAQPGRQDFKQEPASGAGAAAAAPTVSAPSPAPARAEQAAPSPTKEAERALANLPAAPAPAEARNQAAIAGDLADQGRAPPPVQLLEESNAKPTAGLVGKAVVTKDGERRGADALAFRKSRPGEGFEPTAMEAAVRILGGSIRLVDGMTPTRVLVGPGTLVPGADPGREVVRVVYMDPPGRELWLDQQRPDERANEADAPGLAATTLLAGDTLVTPGPEGARSLRWIHQSGFRLGLTGFLPADSLRALARRVQ